LFLHLLVSAGGTSEFSEKTARERKGATRTRWTP